MIKGRAVPARAYLLGAIRIFIFLCFITLFTIPLAAYAEDDVKSEILEEAASDINVDGNFDFEQMAGRIADGESFNMPDVLRSALGMLFDGLTDNLSLLTKIVALCILAGVISNISGIEAGEVSFLACLVIIAGMSVNIVGSILETTTLTIDKLMVFMQSLLPSLSVLIASSGGAVGTVFSPALFVSMQVIIYICKNWFLPLVLFISVLSVVNSMTARFHVTRLIEMCRQVVKWGMGILMTIYIGMLGLQGFNSAFADGIAGRTVKYAICNFIPLVGGVLAESTEAVLGSVMLIKNAVGLAGVIAIVTLCAAPLVNILVMSIVYKLSASICEPATDKRVVSLLSDLSSCISLSFSILLMVSVMFILSVAMLIMLTNIPFLMR